MTTIDRLAVTDADLQPLLAARWSPRGFDAGHALSDADLHALLEAARWAPSCANRQPWRFVVARRGEAAFERIVAHLAEGNRRWAPGASALLIAASVNVGPEGEDWLPWAHYDVGQAVAHLTVQAQALGLAVHQMAGFDPAGIAEEFSLPGDVQPLTAVAIGRFDAEADLPGDLREREFGPRLRLSVADLVLPV
ncbi:MAG: nitroreductase family protein [Sporichthyaceae bacterium]